MKKLFVLLFTATLFITACHKNAVTGRSQLSLFSEASLQQMAVTEYRSFLSQNQVVSENTSKDAEMVRRVGTRIAKAITDYYTQKGSQEVLNDLASYKW